MVPCLDHEAVDRAHRNAKPSGDLGMGQTLDTIEQKGIPAGRGSLESKACSLASSSVALVAASGLAGAAAWASNSKPSPE